MEDTRNDQQLNPPKLKLAKKQSIIRSDPDLEMEVDIAKPKWQYFHKKSIQRSEEPTKDQLKEGTGLWQQNKPHLQQSVILSITNPSRALNQVLQTLIEVTVGDLLRVSKELSSLLLESMKFKVADQLEAL